MVEGMSDFWNFGLIFLLHMGQMPIWLSVYSYVYFAKQW